MAMAKRWESEVIPDIHTIHRGDRNRNELAQRALTGDIRAVHDPMTPLEMSLADQIREALMAGEYAPI